MKNRDQMKRPMVSSGMLLSAVQHLGVAAKSVTSSLDTASRTGETSLSPELISALSTTLSSVTYCDESFVSWVQMLIKVSDHEGDTSVFHSPDINRHYSLLQEGTGCSTPSVSQRALSHNNILNSFTPCECFETVLSSLQTVLPLLVVCHNIPDVRARAVENVILSFVYHIIVSLGKFPTDIQNVSRSSKNQTLTFKGVVINSVSEYVFFLINAAVLQMKKLQRKEVDIRGCPPITLSADVAVCLTPVDDYFWVTAFSLSLLGVKQISAIVAGNRVQHSDEPYIQILVQGITACLAFTIRIIVSGIFRRSGLREFLEDSQKAFPIPALKMFFTEAELEKNNEQHKARAELGKMMDINLSHSDKTPKEKILKLLGNSLDKERQLLVISPEETAFLPHLASMLGALTSTFGYNAVDIGTIVMGWSIMSVLCIAIACEEYPHNKVSCEKGERAASFMSSISSLASSLASKDPNCFIPPSAFDDCFQHISNAVILSVVGWGIHLDQLQNIDATYAKEEMARFTENTEPIFGRLLIKIFTPLQSGDRIISSTSDDNLERKRSATAFFRSCEEVHRLIILFRTSLKNSIELAGKRHIGSTFQILTSILYNIVEDALANVLHYERPKNQRPGETILGIAWHVPFWQESTRISTILGEILTFSGEGTPVLSSTKHELYWNMTCSMFLLVPFNSCGVEGPQKHMDGGVHGSGESSFSHLNFQRNMKEQVCARREGGNDDWDDYETWKINQAQLSNLNTKGALRMDYHLSPEFTATLHFFNFVQKKSLEMEMSQLSSTQTVEETINNFHVAAEYLASFGKLLQKRQLVGTPISPIKHEFVSYFYKAAALICGSGIRRINEKEKLLAKETKSSVDGREHECRQKHLHDWRRIFMKNQLLYNDLAKDNKLL